MAEEGKFVVRPKVRFCQWEDEEEEEEDFRKPRIKNIVTVDKPIKIVSIDNVESKENLTAFDDNYSNKETENYQDFRKFSNEYYQSPVNSSFSSKEDEETNQKLIQVDVHAEDISESGIKSDEANAFLNSKEHLFNRDSEFLCKKNEFLSERNEFLSEKSEFPGKKNGFVCENEFLDKKNGFVSENEFLVEKNGFVSEQNEFLGKNQFASEKNEFRKSDKNLSTISEKSLEEIYSNCPENDFLLPDKKSKTSESKSPKKNFKLTKKQLNSINRLSKAKSPRKLRPENSANISNSKFRRPLGFIQKSSVKPKVVGVMPCLKSKMLAKGKFSPVKKTVLRNISVKPKNFPVSRLRKELDFEDKKMDPQEEKIENKEKRKLQILNSEKLSKPEYNSIMSTINKLKEVQKENIVSDVDHLPPIYKSLVNGKVFMIFLFD